MAYRVFMWYVYTGIHNSIVYKTLNKQVSIQGQIDKQNVMMHLQ